MNVQKCILRAFAWKLGIKLAMLMACGVNVIYWSIIFKYHLWFIYLNFYLHIFLTLNNRMKWKNLKKTKENSKKKFEKLENWTEISVRKLQIKFSMSFDYPFMYRPFITAFMTSRACSKALRVKTRKFQRIVLTKL